MLLRNFLYIDTFLLTNMHSHTPFSHTFFAHMVCFYMCGCLRLPSLLSWLVCAPGRELSIHPSVRQVVYVSVMANCPKPPNLCLTYTLKKICLAISLFSLLYPYFFLFPSIPLSISLLSRLFLFGRDPQRAAITQKRRRWKVGKVLVQFSPTLHASLSSLYHIQVFCHSVGLR